jgi:exopolysaccharide production protein ExoZ
MVAQVAYGQTPRGVPTPNAIPKNHHIQALRGVAASLVVLDHSFGPLIEHGLLPQWFDTVRFSIGGLGVQIFFVISGFIMITTSYDDFGHAAKSLSFALRRIIRIVPTYWIGTLLAFGLYSVMPLQKHPSLAQLGQSLFFIPYSTDPAQDMQPVLGQGWTLNYEMFFYTLFALALLLPRRVGLSALFLAFIGIVAGGATLHSLSDVTPATSVAAFLADPLILLFAVGMVIGVIKHEYHFSVRHPFWIACGLIAVQVFLLIAFHIPPRVPFPLSLATWLPAILAVVVCVFAVPTRSGPFEWISEILGDASYSTYIFHVFVLVALSKVVPITPLLAIPYVLICLISANVFGMVFFRLVERPISGFFRSLTKKSSRKRLQNRPLVDTTATTA